MSIRTIWRPAVYHGHRAKPPYFEGWYYKLVTADGARRTAIIPGVFLHEDTVKSHAFVQVLDGVTGDSFYHRYELAEFAAARDVLDVRIGPNRFLLDRVEVDIDHPDGTVRGELAFEGVTGWPVRLLSPGVMGWYGLVPFMETYHGVLGFDHAIQGTLNIDGEPVAFDGGRGYIEKDWGQAFPRGYIWTQTNHFGAPGTSLTASVALIPWLWRSFRGFIVGLWHAGRLYRFATYTGAQIEQLELTDTHVHWSMTGRTQGARHRLDLDAERAEGGLLHAPDRTAMVARIVESLTATVETRLSALDGGERVVFAGTGRYAGLEIAGDLATILDRASNSTRHAPPG